MKAGVKEMTLLPANPSEVDSSEMPLPVPRPREGAMQTFERLARDKDMDVEKLERLMLMYERAAARVAEEQFNAAMSTAQKDMRPVAADANNPQTRSKYASYAAIDRALRPIYTEHGFGVSFDTADCPVAEYVRVVAYVTHAGGHARTYRIDMPADGKGAKGGDVMTKTHASGAAMSYGMRYLLKMIFNVAVGEDDTDGNTTKDTPPAPDGFQKYWDGLKVAAEKGSTALEAAWACSQDEPYKSFRKYIAAHGPAEIAALKARAKQVGA